MRGLRGEAGACGACIETERTTPMKIRGRELLNVFLVAAAKKGTLTWLGVAVLVFVMCAFSGIGWSVDSEHSYSLPIASSMPADREDNDKARNRTKSPFYPKPTGKMADLLGVVCEDGIAGPVMPPAKDDVGKLVKQAQHAACVD